MQPGPCSRFSLLFAWVLALFQLAGVLPARADGEWQTSFTIPNLNQAQFGPLLISERHRAIIRSGFASNEILIQNYRTGETNRVLTMPSGVFRMVLSPDHQWLYVAFFHPTGTQGGIDTNIMEINLVTPGEPRILPIPDRLSNLIATDGRLVVLNVDGTSESAPYRMRVLDAASGRLGSYTPVSSFILVPSIEQDSVFADGIVAPTMSDTFRHRFDPVTLNWTARRRFPVIRGEEGAPNGFPFGYTPDQRMLLTQFGVYTNIPGDVVDDLRRRAPLDLHGPHAAFFDPRAPKYCFVGEHSKIALLRTDRWEVAKGYRPGNIGALGALAYGRDGEDIVAVFVESTEPDGRVVRFRPPWDLLATNAAPTARLSVSNAAPNTAEALLLDASASIDDSTAQTQLRYRWDLDGDGRFEIPFTNSPVLLHRFERAGPLRVQVEVEDELGERAQSSVALELAFAPMPATPLPPKTPWQFDFGIVAAVFDLPRKRVLAVDAAGHRIIEIATDSGQATREFVLDSVVFPPAIALSPDGRHLYCVEIHRRPLLPTDYNNAYLVQFDLEAGVRAREVFVGTYTSSLAVLPNQFVASMTGSRLEVRRWPDAAPTAWAGIGTFPTALLAARTDGTLYWSQNFDSTLNLRRVIFSPELGTMTTPVVASMTAFQAFVFGDGRYVLMNTGQVRSLTPEAPTDFARVTNIVVEPHVIVTQNAMADARYVEYMNTRYGDRITTLTQEDSERAFREYVTDAQRRLEHDLQFPEEPKQLRFAEDVKQVDGKVQVSGQVAVMSINEKLLQALMARNPDLDFALQESSPLRGTYADALPLGPLMELGAQDGQSSFTHERAAQSLDYWRNKAQEVFADPEAMNSTSVLKSYSHNTAAAANLLAEHGFTAEAEEAYRLAAKIWPGSARSTGGLADLLVRGGRQAEASRLIGDFNRNHPEERADLEQISAAARIIGPAPGARP